MNQALAHQEIEDHEGPDSGKSSTCAGPIPRALEWSTELASFTTNHAAGNLPGGAKKTEEARFKP
jgi:hypothetical protein